jgi:hypothetical protein
VRKREVVAETSTNTVRLRKFMFFNTSITFCSCSWYLHATRIDTTNPYPDFSPFFFACFLADPAGG